MAIAADDNIKFEEGVMVVNREGDKGWGCIYKDARETNYGWMYLTEAPIHDPEKVKNPLDVARNIIHEEVLTQASLAYVVRLTKVEIIKKIDAPIQKRLIGD
jgi:hypothetical protein